MPGQGIAVGVPLLRLSHRVARAVLTHPAVMPLKLAVRDLLWTARGAAFENPPLPRSVRNIVFVCKGNICRSPFASKLMARYLSESPALDMTCSSAGLRTCSETNSPAEACEVAQAYGVSLAQHTPVPMDRALLESQDMVIVMEGAQLDTLRAAYPDLRPRFFLLPLFEPRPPKGYARFNIADPFGQPIEAFEHSFYRIDRAVRALMAVLPRIHAGAPAAGA